MPMLNLAANLSFMFGEVEFLDRFKAAAAGGFRGVEYMFPYDYDAIQLRETLDEHRLTQILFNLPAGNWAAGERGIACHPNRVPEFRDGVARALEYAKVLGCTRVNCLAGIVPPGVDDAAWRDTLVSNLRFAAQRFESAGITLLVESINTSDVPGFALHRTRQAIEVCAAVACANLLLQYDVYHMQRMGEDVVEMISRELSSIGHIQIADVPGRHEPGTGSIDFAAVFEVLERLGYSGWIGCEYTPAGRTSDGLRWLTQFRQAIGGV
jgi:hydroxypyruvate isomerase